MLSTVVRLFIMDQVGAGTPGGKGVTGEKLSGTLDYSSQCG
jgi:hypothetical protein